ncbi:MAG: calmodulin-binding protein [Thermoguttaceae bacterium]|nr:calmodulin-binding protein [Thermoguttaceae bacterium]
MKYKLFGLLILLGLFFAFAANNQANAQDPGRRPSAFQRYDAQDWNRFYYYPYVYYKQNFRSMDQYRSADSLYYRYDRPMQVPTYNPYWQNYYPVPRRFHKGHHFILDVM